MERIVEAGMELARERTLAGVLHRIALLATEISGARYGAIGVLDDDGVNLAQFITVGIDELDRARIGELPRGRGLLGVLIEHPTPLRLEDLSADPRSAGFPPGHPPMRSFLGVPIMTTQSVAGRIYLTDKEGGGPFTEQDEHLVVLLAKQAAVAIDNAEHYAAATQVAEGLAASNDQLREADRQKSAFLANMSHELRSPLNTILGYTRLLIEDGAEFTEEQREDLAIVERSGVQLLELISELLDLSRIEAGRLELHIASIDACQLVEEVAAAMRPQVDPAVRLVVRAAGPLNVACDRSRLRQMLLNILGNAAKFTSEGEIVAGVEQVDGDDGDGEWVRYWVSDTGPGIAPGEHARVFESFYQSSGAVARTPGPNEGAGLGLAITQRLAEAHGGRVEMESTLGEGTTVSILLPATQEAPS